MSQQSSEVPAGLVSTQVSRSSLHSTTSKMSVLPLLPHPPVGRLGESSRSGPIRAILPLTPFVLLLSAFAPAHASDAPDASEPQSEALCGGAIRDAVKELFQGLEPRLRACAAPLRAADPSFSASVQVMFELQPSGVLESSEVRLAGSEEPALRTCLQAEVAAITGPALCESVEATKTFGLGD